MSIYYHLASVQLREGSIIEPGNYGRILQMYVNDASANGWKLATEIAFEAKRARDYPALPSRLAACFAFRDIATAMRATPRMGALNILYEVELEEPEKALHIGDFDLISRCYAANVGERFMPIVESAAASYWAAHTTKALPEVLTTSALRVRARAAPLHL